MRRVSRDECVDGLGTGASPLDHIRAHLGLVVMSLKSAQQAWWRGFPFPPMLSYVDGSAESQSEL